MADTTITKDEWLKALGVEEYEQNNDALTLEELGKLVNRSSRYLAPKIKKLLDLGHVRRVEKRVSRGLGGGTYPSPAYLLIKPKEVKKILKG